MRRRLILGTAVCLIAIGILVTPTLLRAIPPRYAARYLPAPVQAWVAPKTESPVLPTLASGGDIAALLPTTTAVPPQPPPTLTPIPPQGDATAVFTEVSATATAVPTATATAVPIPEAARLTGVYHQFQDWNNCGPATMAMMLSYFGLGVTQYDTAAFLKPNPEDRNVSPAEMVAYVNETTDLTALTRSNGTAETVKRLVASNVPVILEIGIDPPGEYSWMGWYGHYLLVVAYDEAAQQFWVYDSWLGTSAVPGENANPNGRILTYSEVDSYWPQFNRNYIAVYRAEQATAVADIIGENMDDATMWQNNLTIAQIEAAKNPQNPFFWFNVGTANNALGNYTQAAMAYDQALNIGLPWRMLWYQFGPYQAYYEAGRYADVITLADVTLKDRPYFEESFYYRGLAQQALGNTAAAVSDLEAAAKFNPNYTPASTALADLTSDS